MLRRRADCTLVTEAHHQLPKKTKPMLNNATHLGMFKARAKYARKIDCSSVPRFAS
jgi:hypothetical protein